MFLHLVCLPFCCSQEFNLRLFLLALSWFTLYTLSWLYLPLLMLMALIFLFPEQVSSAHSKSSCTVSKDPCWNGFSQLSRRWLPWIFASSEPLVSKVFSVFFPSPDLLSTCFLSLILLMCVYHSLFWLLQPSLRTLLFLTEIIIIMKLKVTCSLEEKLWPT